MLDPVVIAFRSSSGEFRKVKHNLKIVDGAAVVQCHELHVFVASPGSYPAFDIYNLT